MNLFLEGSNYNTYKQMLVCTKTDIAYPADAKMEEYLKKCALCRIDDVAHLQNLNLLEHCYHSTAVEVERFFVEQIAYLENQLTRLR